MPRVIIIPARLASRRLPGKMLLDRTGWTLIQHVHDRCLQVPGVSRVVVATDGAEIGAAGKSFGGEGIETSPELPSGTDRVAAACERLGLSDDHHIVNVQGDGVVRGNFNKGVEATLGSVLILLSGPVQREAHHQTARD